MSQSLQIPVPNLEATQAVARAVAGGLEPLAHQSPITIAFVGPLGAGKTQFIRYLCKELGVIPEAVTSPTYVLMQRYRGRCGEIYHVDYYRLQHAWQVWDLGIDELQEQPVLLLTEWADKFPETLPNDHLRLEITLLSVDERTFRLTASGPISERVLLESSLSRLLENRLI